MDSRQCHLLRVQLKNFGASFALYGRVDGILALFSRIATATPPIFTGRLQIKKSLDICNDCR